MTHLVSITSRPPGVRSPDGAQPAWAMPPCWNGPIAAVDSPPSARVGRRECGVRVFVGLSHRTRPGASPQELLSLSRAPEGEGVQDAWQLRACGRHVPCQCSRSQAGCPRAAWGVPLAWVGGRMGECECVRGDGNERASVVGLGWMFAHLYVVVPRLEHCNLEALTRFAKAASAKLRVTVTAGVVEWQSARAKCECERLLGLGVRVPRRQSLHGVARAAHRGSRLRSRKRQERASRAGRGPGAGPLSICARCALVVSDDDTCRPVRSTAPSARTDVPPPPSHAARPRPTCVPGRTSMAPVPPGQAGIPQWHRPSPARVRWPLSWQ